jgi:hypothetical protein
MAVSPPRLSLPSFAQLCFSRVVLLACHPVLLLLAFACTFFARRLACCPGGGLKRPRDGSSADGLPMGPLLSGPPRPLSAPSMPSFILAVICFISTLTRRCEPGRRLGAGRGGQGGLRGGGAPRRRPERLAAPPPPPPPPPLLCLWSAPVLCLYSAASLCRLPRTPPFILSSLCFTLSTA